MGHYYRTFPGTEEDRMEHCLDWASAAEALYVISKQQIARFLDRAERDDLYGFGYFYDAHEGVVYLVANTEHHHKASFGEYVQRFGLIDEVLFRWDIGNWEHPGGLFPSTAPEQLEFDADWEPFRELLLQMEDDSKQQALEGLCISVLRRLIDEGAFSPAGNVEGFVVLGPDDQGEDVLEKQRRLDNILETTHPGELKG